MDMPKKKSWIGLSAILAATLACSIVGGASQPTATPVKKTEVPSPPTMTPRAATRQPTATRYVSPTATASPTPTASPPLSDSRLYLAFLKESVDGVSVVLMDVDGSGGRRTVPLPRDASTPHYRMDRLAGLSPDGRYFAYVAGDVEQGNSLTLHILRMSDGELAGSIPLLSPEFPDNFRRAAEAMASDPPEDLRGYTVDEMAEQLEYACRAGLGVLDWSPESWLIAFAGQMEGLSSDVYAYDVVHGSLRRLTDGPEEIQYVSWSPDGRWIMHGGAYYVAMGDYMHSHAVSRDGSTVRTYGLIGLSTEGWSDANWHIVHESANGIGDYAIRALDVESGGMVELWPYPFRTFALNRSARLLLVDLHEDVVMLGQPSPGTYLVDIETDERRRLNLPKGGWWELLAWNPQGSYPFLAMSDENGTYAISRDGSIRQLSPLRCGVELSPDRSLLALSRYRENSCGGLQILDQNGDLLRTVTPLPTYGEVWMPDSGGLVYFSGGRLLASRLDGSPPTVLMDPIEEGVDTNSLTWVQR